MSKVRLMIASDHPISRAGLQGVLARNADCDVIGTTSLKEVVSHADVEAPRVVLLHVAEIGARSVRIARDMAGSNKFGVVVVMNKAPHEVILASLLRAGVLGCVVTRSHTTELLRAVQAAANGRRHIDPVLNERVVEALLHEESSLSARERQVLEGLARGLTQREIGTRLGVSTKTVETYRRRLTEKLSLRSRAEIVEFALAMGFLANDGEGEEHSP